MAAARQIVDGPSFTPLPYGLWSAVEHPTPTGPHWQNGVTWSEWCGGGGTTYDPCLAVTGTGGSPAGGGPGTQAPLAGNITQTNRGATSFTVYAEFDCSAVGSVGDARQVAEDALNRVEQWQVGAAFWTGTAGATAAGPTPQKTVFPHLAAASSFTEAGTGIVMQPAASIVATGTGDDAAITMGQLEGALADCYHGQGLIHVAFEALATLEAFKLAKRDPADPTKLYSPAGHRIVVDSGYPGTGPDGASAPAATSWVYGTGAMFGYRGQVMIPTQLYQSFDRTENTVRMIAQRTYLLGWDCCLFAARLNLGVSQ